MPTAPSGTKPEVSGASSARATRPRVRSWASGARGRAASWRPALSRRKQRGRRAAPPPRSWKATRRTCRTRCCTSWTRTARERGWRGRPVWRQESRQAHGRLTSARTAHRHGRWPAWRTAATSRSRSGARREMGGTGPCSRWPMPGSASLPPTCSTSSRASAVRAMPAASPARASGWPGRSGSLSSTAARSRPNATRGRVHLHGAASAGLAREHGMISRPIRRCAHLVRCR